MLRCVVISTCLCLMSTGLRAADAIGEGDLKDLAERFTGSFDSTVQYNMEVDAGLPEKERHARTQLVNARIVAPAFGAYVVYVEEFALGATPHLARRRLVSFELDKATQLVRMRQYQLIDETIDSAKLANLTADGAKPLSGCDVLLRQDGEVFTGAGEAKSCVSENGKEYTEIALTVTPAQIMRSERTFSLENGHATDGRRDDTPTVFFRRQ